MGIDFVISGARFFGLHLDGDGNCGKIVKAIRLLVWRPPESPFALELFSFVIAWEALGNEVRLAHGQPGIRDSELTNQCKV